MEHPLISNLDGMSSDELQNRITDLNKKLNWALRSNNQQLAGQIRLALNSFNAKYQEKQQAIWDAANKNGKDFSDKIKIS